jgi:hypothetical protein
MRPRRPDLLSRPGQRWFKHESPSGNLADNLRGACAVAESEREPVIVAIVKLAQVAPQMPLADVVIHAIDAALEN